MKRTGLHRRRVNPRRTRGAEQAARRLEACEVRSYEAEHVHALWYLDFHHGSRKVRTRAGIWATPLLLALIDAHSRLICHLQWYLDETAETLVHGLGQALQKRGLPRAVMSDNGAAMQTQEFTAGLHAGARARRLCPLGLAQRGVGRSPHRHHARRLTPSRHQAGRPGGAHAQRGDAVDRRPPPRSAPPRVRQSPQRSTGRYLRAPRTRPSLAKGVSRRCPCPYGATYCQEICHPGGAHVRARRLPSVVAPDLRPRRAAALPRPALAHPPHRRRPRLRLRRAPRTPRRNEKLEARRRVGQRPPAAKPARLCLGPDTRSAIRRSRQADGQHRVRTSTRTRRRSLRIHPRMGMGLRCTRNRPQPGARLPTTACACRPAPRTRCRALRQAYHRARHPTYLHTPPIRSVSPPLGARVAHNFPTSRIPVPGLRFPRTRLFPSIFLQTGGAFNYRVHAQSPAIADEAGADHGDQAASSCTRTLVPSAAAMLTSASREKREMRPRSRSLILG